MQKTLLIIDDSKANLESLKMGFERMNYNILTASDGSEGIEILKNEAVDVIITDLMMPEVGGMEVLEFSQKLAPSPSVILITAFGTVESAVESLNKGAFTYLTKPVNLKELRLQVEKAMQYQGLLKENMALHTELKRRYGFAGMIGQSKEMEDIFTKIGQIANTKATVLIQGRSGTGKELVARAIHYESSRADKPFIPVHCASLSESLLESELFGHEKGAFTGAVNQHIGRFELADKGTLFLDEITEIPLSVQVKLLRVLETKEFVRVGGTKSIKVDIRLIAASNRNIQKEVEKASFREDLYYRLKVVLLEIPSLNQRKSDIPILVNHFIKEFSKEHAKNVNSISKEAMDKLMHYHWTGNVRELRNCIENIIVFSTKNQIEVEDLPANIKDESDTSTGGTKLKIGMTLDELEKEYIIETLKHNENNITKTADVLGISRRTLHRKLNELKIDDIV